jgi:hypothetical protein
VNNRQVFRWLAPTETGRTGSAAGGLAPTVHRRLLDAKASWVFASGMFTSGTRSRRNLACRCASVIGFVLLALGATGCGSRPTPGAAIELARPAPADPHSARLVAATGTGAHRLALWSARNADGDLCPGWRLGAGAAPTTFHCQRRGLERPVLWVQGGGGEGENVDWGGDVGLVAPGVTRVEADGKPLALRPAAHLAGWRVFAVGGARQPSSDLTAYGKRQLLEDTGLWINPDGQGCDCSRSATGWSGTYAYVPDQERGTDAHALDVALALPDVTQILDRHGPAWIDTPEGWGSCTGREIGQAAELKLWNEATFTATLPFEEPAVPGTHSAYRTGVHKVFTRHSTELQVWIDTHTWRVVGVETAFEHGIAIPLGTVKDPVPGGGYDDPSQCPQGD